MRKGKNSQVHNIFLAFFIFASFIQFTAAQIGFADSGEQVAPTPAPRAAQVTQTTETVQTAEESKDKPFAGIRSVLPSFFSEIGPADVGVKPWIKPHFSYTNSFVSNADLTSSQVNPAYQTRIAPGLTIAVPFNQLYTELDYTYGLGISVARNDTEVTNTHNFNALARYELSKDTVIALRNNLQYSQVPFTFDRMFSLETADAQITHRLAEKLLTDTRYTFQYFNDGTNKDTTTTEDDFYDHSVSETLTYDVTSDLSLMPRFVWSTRDFKKVESANRKDFWQISPILAATYQLGPKTTLNGHFGWSYRDFQESGNESELLYGAGASHLLGRKLVWGASYSHTLQDTFDTRFVFRDRPEMITLDNFDRQFRVVKSDRIETNLRYNFTERLSFGSFLAVQFVNTEAEDNIVTGKQNDETIMELGPNVSYRINKYISLDLGYVFGRRTTTDNDTIRPNYTYHRATGGLNISF